MANSDKNYSIVLLPGLGCFLDIPCSLDITGLRLGGRVIHGTGVEYVFYKENDFSVPYMNYIDIDSLRFHSELYRGITGAGESDELSESMKLRGISVENHGQYVSYVRTGKDGETAHFSVSLGTLRLHDALYAAFGCNFDRNEAAV